MSGDIFIVEDDYNTVEIVEAALSSFDVNVHHFNVGQDALDALSDITPSLVIVDVRLPAPSIPGHEIVASIKNSSYANVPVIAVTAAGAEGIMKVMKAGGDAYLEKPFNLGALRRMVERYLGAAT